MLITRITCEELIRLVIPVKKKKKKKSKQSKKIEVGYDSTCSSPELGQLDRPNLFPVF